VLPLAISTVVMGVIIVAGTLALAVAVSVVARRRLPREPIEASQDAVSVMFSAVGVLYTVLLAFLVVLVWEQFNGAQERTEQEATRISNLMRDSAAFPPQVRDDLQCRLITYTRSVINEEWETMAKGKSSPVTAAKYEQIWNGFYGYRPQTDHEQTFYGESISKLNELGQERRLRLISSAASIPSVMWILLVVGAVVTIAYLYLFAIPAPLLQHVMIGSVAGLLGFILFMILALDHPFSGDVKVKASAYQSVVTSFDEGGYRRGEQRC